MVFEIEFFSVKLYDFSPKTTLIHSSALQLRSLLKTCHPTKPLGSKQDLMFGLVLPYQRERSRGVLSPVLLREGHQIFFGKTDLKPLETEKREFRRLKNKIRDI